MSAYDNHLVPPSAHYNHQFNGLTSSVSPATTVAINLRQFEKDSKAQAEREYDAEHGPLPEAPAEDDPSIDPHKRLIAKKKRKVRSAIVSRRKSAIYVEKLEAELEMRDNVNADLETRLGVFRDVLRETTSRIHALQRALDVRKDAVPKRVRTTPGNTHGTDPPFFLAANDPNPIDDLLSISPHEIMANEYVQAHGHPHSHALSKRMSSMAARHSDFTSDCSDGQTSPVTPKNHRFEPLPKEFPPISLKEEIPWRGPMPNKALFAHHTPFRGGSTAM